MTKPRITAYKSKGMWNTYYGSLPENVETVIVHQNLSMDELKEHYPDLYKQIMGRKKK